jgi:hypothetical protein
MIVGGEIELDEPADVSTAFANEFLPKVKPLAIPVSIGRTCFLESTNLCCELGDGRTIAGTTRFC